MAKAVKAIPEGYHTITNHMVVDDVARAIDFYTRAFGAHEAYRMASPDGKIMHAELKIGDSMLMLGPEMGGQQCKSAKSLGGSPVSFYLYVTDVDESFANAVRAGCTEQRGVAEMFWGDRCGTLMDPFGMQWTVATRKEDLMPREIEERAKAFFAKQKAA